MEVMGLMLGEFVDDFTVRVVDVFAMPQSGTGVSVEAVDPVFQTKMMDMLRQTGRYDTSVIHLNILETNDIKTGDCCRLVPLPSRLRLLVVIGRYQYAAILRAINTARGCCCGRPYSICQGQSRH